MSGDFDPDDMTVCFKMTGAMFRELEAQAKTLGIEPHEWAKKLVLSGVRSGEKKGWKPQEDWRFLVMPDQDCGVYRDVKEAEQVAARRATEKQAHYLVVPTDATFLGMALVAKWLGVVMDEAKL